MTEPTPAPHQRPADPAPGSSAEGAGSSWPGWTEPEPGDPPTDPAAGAVRKTVTDWTAGSQGWRRTHPLRSALEWVVIVAAALVAALVIKAFVIQAFYIPSGSMEPTLKVGDRVLVNKLAYHAHPIHRGDIVVFTRPKLESGAPTIKDLIKRVIATPGDTIESSGGHLL